MVKKKVLIIVGPTAVGKTSVSIQIAEQIKNAEIISADSRQVYKYMNIGTAKPTPGELKKIKHHFIDIKLPNEYYSAGMYGREARRQIDRLLADRKIPIVVGGSGLYIRALVDGFFDKEISDPEVKQRLKNELEEQDAIYLHEHLQQVDPLSAEKLHPNDGHRIVRALEVYELTGRSLSEFQKEISIKADFVPLFIGLSRERNLLYQTIDSRVDQMISEGLVDEVSKLKQMGFEPPLNSLRTVGYQEVFEFLANKFDFAEMVRLIKQKTRNYAKRQMTWFRKDTRIQWFNPDDYDKKSDELSNHIIEKVLQ